MRMRFVSLCDYDIWHSCRQTPLALPKGEPSSARNALHRTVDKSVPLLSVRQTGIFISNLMSGKSFLRSGPEQAGATEVLPVKESAYALDKRRKKRFG